MEIFEFRNGGTLSTDTLYTLRDGMIVCMYMVVYYISPFFRRKGTAGCCCCWVDNGFYYEMTTNQEGAMAVAGCWIVKWHRKCFTWHFEDVELERRRKIYRITSIFSPHNRTEVPLLPKQSQPLSTSRQQVPFIFAHLQLVHFITRPLFRGGLLSLFIIKNIIYFWKNVYNIEENFR